MPSLTFDPSCCDGGECGIDDRSTQPCGCDKGASYISPWCPIHQEVKVEDHGRQIDSYIVKDSGKREEFAGGMVRDVEEGKTDYTLVLDGPMFQRWAVHLTKGAIKYAARNWMLAQGAVEHARYKRSALRHFLQWFWGMTDEDHAAAVFFNINGAEYVAERMKNEAK